MKKVEVVAAIIYHENEILCVQRPESKLDYISKKFEFPGGKIENGETQVEALRREIFEELEIEPLIQDLFLTVIHPYPDFELTMHSYICQSTSKNLHLTEHIAAKWLLKEDLLHLDWAAADIPIVKKLISNEFIYS
jgi:8-oxo-dGTP diphosphatase